VAVLSNGGGVVTTISNGVTTITATYQGASGSLDVSVSAVTTTIQGNAVTSDGRLGTFALTVKGGLTTTSALTAEQVSGTLEFPGEPSDIPLSGFYDASTGEMSFSGVDVPFRFSGAVAGATVTGTFTGPDEETGTFSSASTTVG
jgi:hypothetical protein